MKLTKFLNPWLILALCLAAFVNFKWLSFDIFQYGDWRFYFAEVSKRFSELSPWDTSYTFGETSLTIWKLPYNYIFGLLGKFGFDSNITDKFLVLWPAVFLPPLASFFFVRQILRSNIAAFAGSLVYSFNTYFLAINTQGHVFLTVSAAFGVLALLFYIRALQQQSIQAYILAAMMGGLSVAYDIRMTLITSIIALLYGLYFVFSNNKKQYVKRNVISSVIMLGSLFVLLNCYWLLPIFTSGSALNNSILQRQLVGDQFFNILRSIILFHPFWSGAKPEWFVVQAIPLYLFFIPLIAFSGFLLGRRNNDVIFFGFIAVLGILLGKQSSEPFAQLYHFLFTTIPGFSAFREATKFYFMTSLAYAVLVGALIAKLNELPVTKYSRLLSYVAWLGVLSVFVLNSKPLLSGDIATMFVKRHVPDEYLRLKQYVLGNNEYSRVLWVPTDTPWEVNNDTHPTVGFASLLQGGWGDIFFNASDSLSVGVEDRFNLLITQPNFHRALANSSIRYIVVPLRDTANDGDFYQHYGRSRNSYINQLKMTGAFNLLNKDVTGATVFENNKFRPHIYTTIEPETIEKEKAFRPIEFDVINRSEYRIHVTNLSTPIYLNFTDNYNSGWKIHRGSISWWRTFIDNDLVLSDIAHTKSNAGLNSFYIDPKKIKSKNQNSVRVNVDGSIDVELTLYFQPQAYMNLGLIISLITLAGCLFYLMISFFSAKLGWYQKSVSTNWWQKWYAKTSGVRSAMNW